jgi:ribosomal protein S12 methylthiotransferase accessory factor
LGRLRGEVTARKSWLLDIGTELQIPCIAAVSVDPEGRGLACGFAARLTPEAAVRSAVLEMCQMELALALARSKLERQGEQALTVGDRRQFALGIQISADDCDLLFPEGLARTGPEAGVDDLDGLGARLGGHGIEVGLVDLSRPNFKLATVFAVAPGLQMLPSGLVSPRLERAMEVHGGGARWTRGLSLF